MHHFDQAFLDFFIDLAPNNHKEWFDENRKRYQKAVKEPMERFVEHLINRLGKEEPRMQGLSPKNCIFRINRDIRFSKDKTPYKLNSSAVISPLGRKDHRYPGLYFELGPDRLAIAGGAYAIDKEALDQLRAHMVLNKQAWKAAAVDANFLNFFPDGLQGEENKRLPAEWQDHAEDLPLLFKKQLFYWREYAPERITEAGLDELLVAHFSASQAVRQLLIEAFGV